MSKWKLILALLLLLTLSVPAAGISDTGDSGGTGQAASAEQDDGAGDAGDAGEGDDPNDDPADDDDPANDDPADDDPADDDPADGGLGEEPADDDVAFEEPSYKNAAQAMHAANLAAAAALQPDQETLDAADNLQTARDDYEDAKAAWEANTDDDLDMALQEAYEIAAGELEKARDAYADAIEDLSGVLKNDISQMRQSGMGWGRIAHELGVHPGALGLARGKKKGMVAQPLDPVEDELEVENNEQIQAQYSVQNEIAEATQRNAKNGWSRGHGLKTGNSGSSQKGLGLSESSATAQNSGGVKGNSSKGSKSTGASGSAAAKSNNGRASDGGPSNSSKGKGAGKSNNGKANGKSGKSNNGKGNGKNK